jgi:hypothetical protein
VLPEGTAAAAGLQNVLRTTSAAFATSIMTTACDNTASASGTRCRTPFRTRNGSCAR